MTTTAEAPYEPFTDAGRFANVGPRVAVAILIGLVALVIFGILGGETHPKPRPHTGPPHSDFDFYRAVNARVHNGEPYYPAVVSEQRIEHYPLRPFMTVRLPTLAVAMAALPDLGARKLSIEILAVTMILVLMWRLHRQVDRYAGFILAFLLIGTAAAPAFIPDGYDLHELWAGELIAISLAVHSPRRWPLSLAIALVAVSIREFAAAYFLAMGVLAAKDGRRGEAAAWAGGLALFFAGLAAHAAMIRPLVHPNDIPSPGWAAFGGWRYLLTLMRWNPALYFAPAWGLAILAPLALIGLAAARGPMAERLILIVGGYSVAFMMFGRPDNTYWGLMISPLWPIGVIFTFEGLRDLVRRAAGIRDIKPS